MANKAQLREAAVKIGTAIGKAERVARVLAGSVRESEKELAALKRSMKDLAREAKKAKKRLQKVLR